MRIYGNPYINEKSNITNKDYKEKTKNKSRTIENDSSEENNQQYSQLKIEEINYNKILNKNKGNKQKQLSVNKEYYRVSPNYYIDYEEKIQGTKHSSSTSKNKSDILKRENNQNNYKNKKEKTTNNIKENKINNNSAKKNKNDQNEEENENMNKKNKNSYKSKTKIFDKLKNIIKKLSSFKRKKKVCFYKWMKLIYTNDRNDDENDDNEEYEEIDDEPEIEEEIEVEEEEEEEEEVHNQLEKIEERAPDEEESTIGIIKKSSKKKYTSAKMKLILRNILRFKSILRIYFRKWFLLSKDKKINKNKNNIKTVNNINKFNNQKELINLKNIILFGKARKRVLKKYCKIWRFITFNLEPVNQHHSNKKAKNSNSNNTNNNQEENKLKKEDSNDSKKYKPKSKANNFKLINNYTKNSYNDNSEKKINQIPPEGAVRGKVKLSKRYKFLKKIIEAINDYKYISYAMSKWYFISKKKPKYKRGKRILTQKNSQENYDESSDTANQNQILAQTAYLNNLNSFNSKEVIYDSDNSQKYLSNSSYIRDNRKREREREREKEKERIREKEIERIREMQREKEKERYREKEKEKINLKMNKKENNEIKEVKAYKDSKNNEMKMLPKAKDLINGITPIDDVRINIDSNNNSNQINRNNNSNEIKNIHMKEQEDIKEISLDNKFFNIKENKTFDEKIDEINKKHLNNKFQRYLLIQLPKSKKKKRIKDNFKIDNKRESFSTLNIKIKMEQLDKTLLKIIKKAYCRKNTIMNCFDKWFDITYNNKNYIPFLHQNKSLPLIHPPDKINESMSVSVSASKESVAKSHKSKTKKGKKPKRVSKEILKASSNEVEIDSRRNSLSSITNNIIKDLKHFKDNVENENSSANKSKFSDSKYKPKNKVKDKKEDIDQKKDKKMNTIDKEKDDDTPKKKLLQIDTANSSAKKEFKKNLEFYNNINKDPKLELKALGVDIIDTEDINNIIINNNASNNMDKKSSTSINKEMKKKRKLHHKRNKSNRSSSNNEVLISSENMESIENILNDNEESTINNIESTLNLDKNKTEENINDKINEIKTLKNNLKEKKSRHSSGSDINPDVVDIEIIQAEENLNGKKTKKAKSRKSESRQENDEDDIDKSNNEIDKKYSKEERKLIKKYKKALHRLRAVIRSHRKRRKELNTFNPDLAARRAFQKWVSETFPQGLDQYRNQKTAENSDAVSTKNKIKKPKKKNKEKNDLEAIKLKKLRNVIKSVNKKNKSIIDKVKNENKNEILKVYFNKWHDIAIKIRQNEQKNIVKEKEQNSAKKANKKIIIILNNEKETKANAKENKELNKEIKKDKIKEVNKEKVNSNNLETLKYKQKEKEKEKEKELQKESQINKEINKGKLQIKIENNEKTKEKINDVAKGIIKDIKKDKIKDIPKEIIKDNSKDKIKDISKESIKDNSKDKIKDINEGKTKDKNLEPKEQKEKSIVNNDKNIEKQEELKPKDIKQIPNVAQQPQKNDVINTNPAKKFNRPVIDWNELSREESYSPIEDKKNKDEKKVGLTKSQVIKAEDKQKKSKTQSKNDNDENEEDFYFMKIIQRKKNNDMKKKLFDKLCTQIENNIKENFIEENKKEENADNSVSSDDEEENESENSHNNLEKNNLNNLLNSTEKKKRIKILKGSQSNISNNNEMVNYNLDSKCSKVNSIKTDDEKVSSLINISSAEKEKKYVENSDEDSDENEKKRQREIEEQKQKEKEKELQRQKELKEKEEKEKIEKERKERERKEKEEKERHEKEIKEKERLEKENKEKIEKEILEKNFKNTYQNIHIINPNQNKYDTPKKLIPTYDPYEKQTELPKAPKVQPPRQVLELERLKGKSRLPDIQRTFSFNRKKFGLGNLDVVEPGELVSNIKLRQIKDMLVRQSDSNIVSKSTFKEQNGRTFDFVSSSAFSKKKYDSDNEEKKVKITQVKKILNDIIKKLNNKMIKIKTEKYFKKWKNPSKYVKNMPNIHGVTMLDCAPPPKQERRSSVIPIVFLSKSLINESKPFILEEEKNIESDDTNSRIDNNFVNIEKINPEKKENRPINNYRKDSMPQKVKNGGRIEFVFPSQKEFSSQKKENNVSAQKIEKKNEEQEEEEEEEEEFEEEEKSEFEYRNINNNGNNITRKVLKFDTKSSISSKSDLMQSYNNSSNKKNGNNIINYSDNKSKEIKNSNNNNIYINKSKEKYKLISPEIYKLNSAGNRTKNNILNLMNNISGTLFQNINSDIFINLSKKYIKDFGAYHIFTLYSLFNKNHEFYDKRNAFNVWKKIISRPKSKYYNIRNNFNYYDCENFGHCLGCICHRKDNRQVKIKRILIKYIFMREYNPVKYYLFLWYKKTFIKKNR